MCEASQSARVAPMPGIDGSFTAEVIGATAGALADVLSGKPDEHPATLINTQPTAITTRQVFFKAAAPRQRPGGAKPLGDPRSLLALGHC